jgi:hypothetical protein
MWTIRPSRTISACAHSVRLPSRDVQEKEIAAALPVASKRSIL